MSAHCWFCDGEIDPSVVEREGYLVPRKTSEGGPLWLVDCPLCGTRNGGERNIPGAFLLVPYIAPGLRGWIAALSSPSRLALRAHARAWFRRNASRRRAFHEAEPRAQRPGGPEASEPEPSAPGPAVIDHPPPEEPEPEAPPEEPRGEDVARLGSLIEHYRTLDVSLSATREQVTSAYRRLSQRCHPDKVAHLDEEFQALAERKFRALREAYEAIVAGL